MESALIDMLRREQASLRAEKERLDQEVSERQARLANVSERLKAVDILMVDDSSHPPKIMAIEMKVPPGAGKSYAANGITMIDAIEKIANESLTPVPKGDVRRQLMAMGFPPSSLQNYFYTVIMRLKNKDRIAVLDDGSLSRPGASH